MRTMGPENFRVKFVLVVFPSARAPQDLLCPVKTAIEVVSGNTSAILVVSKKGVCPEDCRGATTMINNFKCLGSGSVCCVS